MTEDIVPHPLDDEEIYIYGDEDLQDILADSFVDLREIVDDEDACECIDIVYQRLTDEFYSHE